MIDYLIGFATGFAAAILTVRAIVRRQLQELEAEDRKGDEGRTK